MMPTSRPGIEPACVSDLGAIKCLLADCSLYANDLTPTHLAHFFVARQDNRVAGTVGLELLGSGGLLRSLAVASEVRGMGTGSALASHAEEHARDQGVEKLYLLTTTAESFFARRGYQATARGSAPEAIQETTEFGSLCPESAACMVKNLIKTRRRNQ